MKLVRTTTEDGKEIEAFVELSRDGQAMEVLAVDVRASGLHVTRPDDLTTEERGAIASAAGHEPAEETGEEKRVLTTAEAMDLLCVSQTTVCTYAQDGVLPHAREPKPGRTSLFPRPAVEALARHKRAGGQPSDFDPEPYRM